MQVCCVAFLMLPELPLTKQTIDNSEEKEVTLLFSPQLHKVKSHQYLQDRRCHHQKVTWEDVGSTLS